MQLFVLAIVASLCLALAPKANAQNQRAKASICDDAKHPSHFIVAGRYFHINRGAEDVADARFHIKTHEGQIVSHAEAKPNETFEALIPWRFCSQALVIETTSGNRFSIAREFQFSPSDDLLDFYGKRVIRLLVPIVEGSRGASLGVRTNAFRILIGSVESSLLSYADQFGSRSCCATPQAEEAFLSIVISFGQAESLLAGVERTRIQYIGLARIMTEIVSIARGNPAFIPPSWIVLIDSFASDPKLALLTPVERARVSRYLSLAASSLIAGATKTSETGQSSASVDRLRQIASDAVRESASSDLIRQLGTSGKYLGEMWNLTIDSSLALVRIEGDTSGALDLYEVFFRSAPIANEVNSLEIRRKVAVQSAIYYGQYLDILTKRTEMSGPDYIKSVKADPKKLAYWSAFALWLKKNDAFFVGGTTDEARVLKSYSAIAKAVSE